jgi:hypothetical protein
MVETVATIVLWSLLALVLFGLLYEDNEAWWEDDPPKQEDTP